MLEEALLQRSGARSQGGQRRLVLSSPSTSPGSAGGAHRRLSVRFADYCSPSRSCSHASTGGGLRQLHQSRSTSVCPALLEGNLWPPSPLPLQRGPVDIRVRTTDRGICRLRFAAATALSSVNVSAAPSPPALSRVLLASFALTVTNLLSVRWPPRRTVALVTLF